MNDLDYDEYEAAWLDIYAMMEDNAFDYFKSWARVPAPFENAGEYVEVPF